MVWESFSWARTPAFFEKKCLEAFERCMEILGLVRLNNLILSPNKLRDWFNFLWKMFWGWIFFLITLNTFMSGKADKKFRSRLKSYPKNKLNCIQIIFFLLKKIIDPIEIFGSENLKKKNFKIFLFLKKWSKKKEQNIFCFKWL